MGMGARLRATGSGTAEAGAVALERWEPRTDDGAPSGARLWLRVEGGGVAAAEVSIAPNGSVRLRATRGDALPPDPGPAIGREPWPRARIEPWDREGGGIALAYEGRAGAASVEIDPAPFRMLVRDRAGGTLADLSELCFDAAGGARIDLASAPDERLLGFGEKRGPLDKRGRSMRMRTWDPPVRAGDELYAAIPFFLGLRRTAAGGGRGPAPAARARGVLLDALGPSRFAAASADAPPDAVRMTAEHEGIDLVIFPGPSPAEVLERFTARVGRTPLPPRWALGHHQSRWSYGNERSVRRVVRELRGRGIPTDAVHLDIDHMRGYRVFTWHPRRFPDPKGLLADLARDGVRVVAIVDPGVKADSDWDVYLDGLNNDVFCKRADGAPYRLRVWPGEAALPDFNRPDVRDWWSRQHAPLLDAGVAGIWNDMNEPAGWRLDLRLGKAIVQLLPQDTSCLVQREPRPAESGLDPARDVPHEHVRNLYGLQECRATRAALEAAQPDRRPFVLTRSGHAGIQRHAAVWTGDTWSRWSHLRESIPMLLNLSLSGVGFCGADIGGFEGSCTPELFARWCQIGALYPFARTHASWAKRRQEAWSFGPRVEAIARDALRLRMRLLPYLYGLFHEAERTGAPVWRAMAFEFPADAEAGGLEDQLMLGPSLLVAPVLQRGERERDVWLPAGVWIDWHTGARLAGPGRVRIPAPLERLPLFARGGSVVPTQSATLHTGQAPEEPLVLEVFPGEDGSGELLEDDGESLDYRRGGVARTRLRLRDRAGGRLRVEIGRREGDFAIPPRALRVRVHACGRPEAVVLDGMRLEEGPGAPAYSCDEGCVNVRLEDRGRAHSIEVEPAP